MHTIKATPECLEPSDVPSTCLSHRQRVIAHSAASGGLGPLDLVWCQKRAKGAFGKRLQESYHHVVGHDVINTASAAAYFADLCTSGEEVCIPCLSGTDTDFCSVLCTCHGMQVVGC